MTLTAGSVIGPYSIDREIGRGGMGVVYLGRDTRLDRAVAIKSLPEHFAENPERLARFEREAKTLAQLNHPNVAGIYGVEEHDVARYLVLEYVDGETLADRLGRGALPVDEAIEFAIQIASGVEAAHEAGVIHRDLKPANVKITPEGKVKVLDFGLARAEETPSSGSSVSQLPTMTTPHSPTTPGAILGTAPYMSPEQARGRKVDKRSDIWSFGVVLYECLTGASPFVGETASDSIGAILHKDVDLDRLPSDTSRGVRRVLARCLQRDKDQRFRDIGDVRLELQGADNDAETDTAAGGNSVAKWAGTLVAGLIVGGTAVWFTIGNTANQVESGQQERPRRFTITLPASAPIAPPSVYPFGVARQFFEVSPDGETMIYTALVDGHMHLYARDMTDGTVEPIPNGQGGFGAAISRDGATVAFFANERLYKMGLDRRNAPEPQASASTPTGSSWAKDGSLYFSPVEMSSIYEIPPAGGQPILATKPLSRGRSHVLPRLVLDDRFILYTEFVGRPRLLATPVDNPDQQLVIMEYASAGWITPSDHLVFSRDDRLMAVKIDPETFTVLGDPVTVLSDVRSSWAGGQFVITEEGALIYAEGMHDETGRFVLVDRDGAIEQLNLGLRKFVAFALSPDGRYLATPISDGRDTDIWIYDLQRPQTPARITFGGIHNAAVWSSDGRFLLFGYYDNDGGAAILAQDVQSGAPAFTVFESDSDGSPLDYHAPNGELLFTTSTVDNQIDLMRGFVDLTAGEGATLERIEAVRATRHEEAFAAISPDRNWIVANSDETGRWELFLSSYPDFGSRIQVSSDGGEEPIWTDDGSRFIYRWEDTWYEVEVSTEPQLSASDPRAIAIGPYINVFGYSWDMTKDGEKLLLVEGPQQDTPVTELQVITNFLTELDRIAPHPGEN